MTSTNAEVSGCILMNDKHLSGSFRMHTHQNGVPIRKFFVAYNKLYIFRLGNKYVPAEVLFTID
jgi:hypothetical protein